MTAKPIVFDLEQLKNPESIDPDNYFYAQEMEELFGKLRKFGEVARAHLENHENDSAGRNYYQTIAIIGNRGAGKTTFVKSMPRYYEKKHKDTLKVEFIDLIDPTTLEPGLFLTTVLSMIFSKVNAVFEKNREGRFSDIEDWRELTSTVAQKFQVLLGDSWKSKWAELDEELLAQQINRHASDGLSLGASVHKVIASALKILKKDVMVLPIDDCDTMIGGGFEVLETVRKYLNSPCLIPIVTGNLDLFETILMNHFYKETGHVPKESTVGKNLEHEIGVLSNQYLAKVLNPNNRITLNPIADHWSGIHLYRACSIAIESEDQPVTRFFSEFLTEFLGYPFNLSGNRILRPRSNPFASLFPRNNRILMAVLLGIKKFMDKRKSFIPNRPAVLDENPQIEFYDNDINDWEQYNFMSALQEFLTPYWYYFHCFGISTDMFLQFYKMGEESVVSNLLINNLKENNLFFAQSGYYSDKKDGLRQRNILVALMTMVLSRSIKDRPSRMLSFMLLACELPRGVEIARANQDEVAISLLTLDRGDSLVNHMERYGSLIGMKQMRCHESEYGSSKSFSVLALQSLPNGGLLFNPYRYLALAGEIPIFISRRGSFGSGDVKLDILRLIEIFALNRTVQETNFNELARACEKWFYFVESRTEIKIPFRPFSRVLALSMLAFDRALDLESNNKIGNGGGRNHDTLKDFILKLVKSVYVEELIASDQATTVPFDVFASETFKLFPFSKVIKADDMGNKKREKKGVEPRKGKTNMFLPDINNVIPITITQVLITNPLIRLALDESFEEFVWISESRVEK